VAVDVLTFFEIVGALDNQFDRIVFHHWFWGCGDSVQEIALDCGDPFPG
jgi:hypothetical protein